MAKYRFSVEPAYVVDCGYEEIVDVPTEGLDPKQKHDFIQETFEDWLWEHINAGYEEMGDD